MPKVVFDKLEMELWLQGRSTEPSPNPGVSSNMIPNGWTHEEWRTKVAEALHILAGHMGGYGVDLVSEDGTDLSDPTNEEQKFSYASPTKTYAAVIGTSMITMSHLKDN